MAQVQEQAEAEAQAVREIEGIELPPAGTYELDVNHSQVGFVARHMLAKVRGRFADYSGTITVAEDVEDSSAQVEIQTASVQTGNEQRDEHLRTGDFFLVEEHPLITFSSTALRPTGGNGFALDGDLSIRGVTKPVTLEGEFFGWNVDPFGTTVFSASASTTVEREDWGVSWNQALETGGFLVSKKIELEIEVEAKKVG